MNIALIVFGGKGERISSDVPKQFIKIKGKDVVSYTISVFQEHPLIDEIVLVCHKDYLNYTKQLVIINQFTKVRFVVPGGETRQDSVREGLNATNYNDNDNILIHDGDRPLVKTSIISQALRLLDSVNACYPAIKSSEGIKIISNSGRKKEINGVSYDIQTPQCFKYKLIKDRHNRLKGETFSDDISLLEILDEPVEMFIGDKYNFKVTLDRDLNYFRGLIENDGREEA